MHPAAFARVTILSRLVSPSASPTAATWSSFSKTFASTASSVKEVSTDSEFNSIIEALKEGNKVAVVDFTAKWCGPCRQIAPIYEKLAIENPEVTFLKVDIDDDKLRQTVVDHNISSVPTFTFYVGSSRKDTFSGARPDMLKTLLQRLSSP